MENRRVFVSYRRTNQDAVKDLIKDVKAVSDHVVWYDQKLTGGQNWWDTILAQIRAADIVVLALSEDYFNSEPCQLEYEYAQSLEKAIIPISVDPTLDPNDIPPDLSSIQITFRDDTNYAEYLKELREALRIAESPPLPDPLPSPPSLPVSKLNDLRDELRSRAPISFEKQKEIIDDLKWHLLEKPEECKQVVELMRLFIKRNEIAIGVRDQAEELVRKYENKCDGGGVLVNRQVIAGLLVFFLLAVLLLFIYIRPVPPFPPTSTVQTPGTPASTSAATSSPMNTVVTPTGTLSTQAPTWTLKEEYDATQTAIANP